MTITLTDGQQAAYEQFATFIMDPTAPVMVIEGFSGTGKSTLVKTLIERLPAIMKMARLIHPSMAQREVWLTATTNKAAEALSHLTGQNVLTIHSFLGLRVNKNIRTGETTLVARDRGVVRHDCLIFIDEASYIDRGLLKLIFQQTKHCKIVFMGDPAQLTPVKSTTTPVFAAGYPTAKLTEVVRQAKDNPIIDLSTKFRETVSSGDFFKFIPDGHFIQYLDRNDFEDAILADMTRQDWSYHDSKVLGWTNKTVVDYNQAITNHVTGTPEFQVGDYGICNQYMNFQGGSIKTDQTVLVTHKGPLARDAFGVEGHHIEVDGRWSVFLPCNFADKKKAVALARENGDYKQALAIENNWIDLRAAYACTINKAQGSTFKRVYIDLDDIKRCTSGNQIARLLYVGVSRASEQVFLTGDLV